MTLDRRLTFGPISGAHLNPAVTLAEATRDALPWRQAGHAQLVSAGAATAPFRWLLPALPAVAPHAEEVRRLAV
jgi:glycerol uptake facilitator-like aquaporin